MNLLKEANEWVQKGYSITYYVVDQIENGYEECVLDGDMPKFTYTFAIYKNNAEIFLMSVDSLEEGYNEVLKFLKKNY